MYKATRFNSNCFFFSIVVGTVAMVHPYVLGFCLSLCIIACFSFSKFSKTTLWSCHRLINQGLKKMHSLYVFFYQDLIADYYISTEQIITYVFFNAQIIVFCCFAYHRFLCYFFDKRQLVNFQITKTFLHYVRYGFKIESCILCRNSRCDNINVFNKQMCRLKRFRVSYIIVIKFHLPHFCCKRYVITPLVT